MRLRAVTWRRASHVTPNQIQCVVEMFHEERTGGVESVIVSRRERSARYSEIGDGRTF